MNHSQWLRVPRRNGEFQPLTARETRDYQPLIRAIGLVFSDPVRVDAGFAKPAAAASDAAEVGDDSKMETDESAGAPASLGGGSDSASAPLAIDIDNVAEAYRIVFAAADEVLPPRPDEPDLVKQLLSAADPSVAGQTVSSSIRAGGQTTLL